MVRDEHVGWQERVNLSNTAKKARQLQETGRRGQTETQRIKSIGVTVEMSSLFCTSFFFFKVLKILLKIYENEK